MVNLIPEIIREQDPPTAQTPRQENNQRNRIRRSNAKIQDMRAFLPDDDVLSEIAISDDDDNDDQDNPQGSDRRHSEIINRPEQRIRPVQSIRPRQLIRLGQPIRPNPTIVKQEPTDQSVVPDIDEDIDNLLDRQMARARQRIQQQEQNKSSTQKKRSLNEDSEGSSKQKRRATDENNVKDPKPGFPF